MQTTAARSAGAEHLPEDAALVAALRKGDEQTFLLLVRRYGGAMLRTAQAYVSSRAVAEEAVQEAWLGVFNGLARFGGRSSLRAWIFGILINCAQGRGAREARSVPLSSLAAGEDGPAVDPDRFLDKDHPRWPGHWACAPSRWTDQQLLDHEAASMVHREIEKLPARQRLVITLRDVEGLSAKEACEALGVTEANQRVLLHRARSRIRGALEVHLDEAAR